MKGAGRFRRKAALFAILSAMVLALAMPASGLAGGSTPGGAELGGGGEENTGTGLEAGGGGLAATGFDAWKIGLVGLVLIAGSLVLVRSVRPVRR